MTRLPGDWDDSGPRPTRRDLTRARERFLKARQRYGFNDTRTLTAAARYRDVLAARIAAEESKNADPKEDQ